MINPAKDLYVLHYRAKSEPEPTTINKVLVEETVDTWRDKIKVCIIGLNERLYVMETFGIRQTVTIFAVQVFS